MTAPARLSGLDGLRAISIALVILGHVGGTQASPLPATEHIGVLAGFGVRVFFVISGFLITTLLLKEHARSGTISLQEFYIRRTYRIFPAFYVYLAAIVGAEALGWIATMPGDLLAAATYTMNYHRPRSWYLGHLWSLSVEEQFYLLWPAIVAFCHRRVALGLAAVAVVAAPLLRVGIFVLMPGDRMGIGETFPTVFDALAMGCLLAGFRERLEAHPLYAKVSESPLFVLVPVIGFAALYVPRVSFDLAIGTSLQNIAIALTVHWVVRHRDTWIGRILDAGPLAWVGRLSYSLYLWQQPFVNRSGTHWTQAFPVHLALGFTFAIASYYAIEQPFLRLRDRFRRVS